MQPDLIRKEDTAGSSPTPSRAAWIAAILVFCSLLLPPVRDFWFESGRRWLYILFFAASLSFILTPIMIRIARRFDILDSPGDRKIHKKSTPLLGGLAVVIAFISSLVANMVLTNSMVLVMGSSIVIALVSLEDDRREISATLKLLIQILVVLFLILNGIVLALFPPLEWWGYALNIVFTLMWIVGITNSMNFIDGMDGLAAGVGAIISFFIGIVAFQTMQPAMGWIAIAVMGSCLGFLPYNLRTGRPAAVFLGDTGSTFLGFTLATLAVLGDWADNPVVSFSAPVLIFWVLIYDMAHITVYRIVTGRVKSVRQWIDYVGKDHIHHRMYDLLGSRKKAVFFIYFLCTTLGISAIALRHARLIDGILLVGQALLITIVVTILEYSGRHRDNDRS